MHVELHVVQTAAVLAAGTGAFPAAKGLEAGPRAGGRTLWTVGIGHTGFDVVEKPFGFLVRAIEASRQAIVDIIGDSHGLVQIFDFANRGDG